METVQVEGAKELRRAIRQFGDSTLPDALKDVHRAVADLVAAEAKSRAPVRSGRLRESIRASGQLSGAVVREGGARVPYAAFIDFGGNVRFKSRNGVITRPFLHSGRILYPAIDAKRDEVIDLYERRISDLTKDF